MEIDQEMIEDLAESQKNRLEKKYIQIINQKYFVLFYEIDYIIHKINMFKVVLSWYLIWIHR